MVLGERHEIVKTENSGGDYGTVFDIHKNYMVVSAHTYSSSQYINIGRVYIYYRHQGGTNTWNLQQIIDAPDDGSLADYDYFGSRVVIYDEYLVITKGIPYYIPKTITTTYSTWAYKTRPSRVYIYKRTNNIWSLIKVIVDTNLKNSNTSWLGSYLSIYPNDGGYYLAVGAPIEYTSFYPEGKTHVYYSNFGGIDNWGEYMSTWNNTNTSDYFGISGQIYNGFLIQGAKQKQGRGKASFHKLLNIYNIQPIYTFDLYNLGYTSISSFASEITINDNYIFFVSENLAVTIFYYDYDTVSNSFITLPYIFQHIPYASTYAHPRISCSNDYFIFIRNASSGSQLIIMEYDSTEPNTITMTNGAWVYSKRYHNSNHDINNDGIMIYDPSETYNYNGAVLYSPYYDVLTIVVGLLDSPGSVWMYDLYGDEADLDTNYGNSYVLTKTSTYFKHTFYLDPSPPPAISNTNPLPSPSDYITNLLLMTEQQSARDVKTYIEYIARGGVASTVGTAFYIYTEEVFDNMIYRWLLDGTNYDAVNFKILPYLTYGPELDINGTYTVDTTGIRFSNTLYLSSFVDDVSELYSDYNQYTWSFWINCSDISSINMILQYGLYGTHNKANNIFIENTEIINSWNNTEKTDENDIICYSVISENTLHHIVIQYDSITRSVYVDNILVGTKINSDLELEHTDLLIGNEFNGYILDLRFYNITLPETGPGSIELLFTNGPNPPESIYNPQQRTVFQVYTDTSLTITNIPNPISLYLTSDNGTINLGTEGDYFEWDENHGTDKLKFNGSTVSEFGGINFDITYGTDIVPYSAVVSSLELAFGGATAGSIASITDLFYYLFRTTVTTLEQQILIQNVMPSDVLNNIIYLNNANKTSIETIMMYGILNNIQYITYINSEQIESEVSIMDFIRLTFLDTVDLFYSSYNDNVSLAGSGLLLDHGTTITILKKIVNLFFTDLSNLMSYSNYVNNSYSLFQEDIDTTAVFSNPLETTSNYITSTGDVQSSIWYYIYNNLISNYNKFYNTILSNTYISDTIGFNTYLLKYIIDNDVSMMALFKNYIGSDYTVEYYQTNSTYTDNITSYLNQRLIYFNYLIKKYTDNKGLLHVYNISINDTYKYYYESIDEMFDNTMYYMTENSSIYFYDTNIVSIPQIKSMLIYPFNYGVMDVYYEIMSNIDIFFSTYQTYYNPFISYSFSTVIEYSIINDYLYDLWNEIFLLQDSRDIIIQTIDEINIEIEAGTITTITDETSFLSYIETTGFFDAFGNPYFSINNFSLDGIPVSDIIISEKLKTQNLIPTNLTAEYFYSKRQIIQQQYNSFSTVHDVYNFIIDTFIHSTSLTSKIYSLSASKYQVDNYGSYSETELNKKIKEKTLSNIIEFLQTNIDTRQSDIDILSSGDLITDITNKQDSTERASVSWINNIGNQIFDYADLYIDDVCIESLNPDIQNIHYQLISKQKTSYNKMIGNITELTSYDNTIKLPYRLYIPLFFFFNESFLPLISLNNADVYVKVKLKSFDSLLQKESRTLINRIPPPKMKMIGTFIFVEELERTQLVNNRQYMLINRYIKTNEYYIGKDLLKDGKVGFRLNLHGNIKEIYWVLNIEGNNQDVYTYDNEETIDIITRCRIKFNGVRREDWKDVGYWNSVFGHKYHLNIPKKGIYGYSFALYPDSHQPSGSLNSSMIDEIFIQFELGIESILAIESGKQIKLSFFTKQINFLNMMSGLGDISFR